MSSEIIKVPDIGGSTDVEIIEIAVSEGDEIAVEDTMITLESDKASMDVPAPKGGKVVKVLVKEGDSVSEGDDILELEAEGGGESEQAASKDNQAASKDEQDADEKQEASAKQDKPKQDKKSADSGASRSDAQPAKQSDGKRTVEIKVPDIGGSEDVPIIELAVAEGDEVSEEDPLITLESDKASMDVPSPYSGKLVSLAVKEGDSVSEGDLIGTLEITDARSSEGGEDGADSESESEQPSGDETASDSDESQRGEVEETESSEEEGESQRKEIRVPDIGGSESVPIIELAVAEGDEINEEDPLITLESDKASMDVPSPFKGKLVELAVKEGDTVSEGDLIGYVEVVGSKPSKPKQSESSKQPAASDKGDDKGADKSTDKADAKSPPQADSGPQEQAAPDEQPRDGKLVHAGPAVRMLARELGVELAQVKPSGPKDRVLKEDVHAYVKQAMKAQQQGGATAAAPAAGGSGIPPIPDVDFSQFGEIEEKPMGRLMKMGATNLHRSWVNLPHVTQFDEADITELEAFRKSMKAEAEAQGAKLTPLPFLIKACAYALRQYPQFSVSLKSDGETLVWKKYVHIGIAVDTPDGLMVPVIRNADQKSLIELAKESAELAKKAQSKKLKREEMQGGCFTISSLGSIGGTAFTPIVNAPEVAILGISKSQTKPVWNGAEFTPRLMMPLCLSYDHRAVNGADAARFTAFLAQALSDIRRMLM